MNGTLATSGSLPSSCRKRVIAATPSIIPSSMQMSMMFAPFSTCCRATATASSYLFSLMSFANFGEPATFVRSPIMMNCPICCVNGCEPLKRSGIAAPVENLVSVFVARGGLSSSAFAIAAMCSGVLPQQPPAMLSKPLLRKFAEKIAHVLRLQIKARRRQRIRQTRVRITRNRRVGFFRKFREKRPHQIRAERAVQADGNRLDMLHRVPKRLDGLRGNHRFTAAADGGGNHDRQNFFVLLEHFLNRHERGLGVERIENRFDQQNVRAARDERANLVRCKPP